MHTDRAREVIDQALAIWNANRVVYKPEIARSSFLKAKILHHAGLLEDASSLFKEAANARRELAADKQKLDRDLVEDDFNDLVTFWSM